MGYKYRVFLGLSLAVLMTTGCVKKRPDVEAQGAALGELVPTGAVTTWKHSITTANTKPEFTLVTEAEELRVNSDVENINVLGVVDFETDSPFLQSAKPFIRLLGKSSTKYEMVYSLTPNFLILFKKVPLKEASHQEIPFGVVDGNTLLMPLGGYKVNYFTVQFIKTDDNRDSNVKNKYPVSPENYRSASHFKVDTSSFIPVTLPNTRDLYPASYFTEGQWYYAKAVISTKPGEEDGIGVFEGGVSTAFELANKIRFRQHKGYLRGVNVAIAEQKKKAEKKEGDAEDDVIAIPVDWKDYRAIITDKGPTGEAFDYRPDNQRSYGLFDFVHTTTLSRETPMEMAARRVIKDIKLEDLHFSKDGFSYTLTKVATGEKVRYAFKRVKPSSYVPLVYRQSENSIFGAFYTVKPYVATSKDDRKGDLEAAVLINRFDPTKPIVFRFSKDTPKIEETSKDPSKLQIDYREVGRRCVRYWNRAFEVAGSQVKVEIREDEDGEVGDINSNIINIIDTLNETGLAGVGPSLADPETGEIVAGAANVYISAYRKGITDRLRNYIRVRSGLARDFAFSKEIQSQRRLMDYSQKEFEHFCPEVGAFADSLKGKPQYTSAEENKYIDRCLEKMLPRVLSEVTCHEMGHVFALRHNFQCSADPENGFKDYAHMEKVYPRSQFPEIYNQYYPKAEFFPEASCLMDYLPDSRPQLMVPGLYDVAALAYIYSGKVEKKGTRENSKNGIGELVSFDRTRPLNEQPQYLGSQRYAFCDDYEAGTSQMLPMNPLCMRHDFGNTPTKLMDYYYDALRDDVVLNFRKWDRISARESMRPIYYMENMTSIYKLWRAYLYDFVGAENGHLQNVKDEEAYAKLKEDLNRSFKHKDFLGINERYVKYMSSILNVPDLFCVAVRGERGKSKINGNSDVRLISFKKASDEMLSTGVEKVDGCADPSLATHLSMTLGSEWKVAGEIGYPTDNLQFSKAKADQWEGMDIVGLGELRKDAMNRLTVSLGNDRVRELKLRGFMPNALDEPFVFNAMKNSVEQRLFEGLDVSGPVAEMLTAKGYELDRSVAIRPYKKFESDWQMYKAAFNQFSLFRNVEKVNQDVKDSAQVPFTVEFSKQFDRRRPREAFFYYDADRVYFFASPTASGAYRAINKLNEMEQPVRFDLGSIDQSTQEAYWQLSEALRDLPVTVDHTKRLDFATFSAFSQRLAKLLSDTRLEASLKAPALQAVYAATDKLNAKIQALVIAANGQASVTPAADGDVQLTAEKAKATLSAIQARESMFAQFAKEEAGVSREMLNQAAIAELWVNSTNNETLKARWTRSMLPEINDRLRFMTDDPVEYEEQRKAMLSLVITGLAAISRDPL